MVKDHIVKIVKANGSLGSENKLEQDMWASTDANSNYGDINDLWGETDWTAEGINDSNFGVVISPYLETVEDVTAIAYVDAIYITVYYTI